MSARSPDDVRYRDGITDVQPPPASPAPPQAEPEVISRPIEEPRDPGHDLRVYDVGGRKVSIFDLLRRFGEGDFQAGGLSRLADLHLKVGGPARYRHDGALVPLQAAANLTPEVMRKLVYPLLVPHQIKQLEEEVPADVDSGFHFETEALDFRLNVFHDRDGLAAVIRALPRHVPDTKALGFPDHRVIEDILSLRQGLVVVTGITGSGKSTTIASILSELNRNARLRVITLEDPVEYVMRPERCLISQREVGKSVRGFSAGLRSALREDPDVILVGEIRDTETASLALSAAETGHLVFTTLHTRDTKGVVTRIVDLFPADRSREVMSQISFSMAYVIAQKLLPRKDGQGRVAAFEIMRNVPAIANLIRTGNWHQIYATIQLSAKERMVTMERHLAWLVKKGLVSPQVAVQYANDPSQLTQNGGGAVQARTPQVQAKTPKPQG